ncbi:hypothetical protein [Microbacterium maritypicum]
MASSSMPSVSSAADDQRSATAVFSTSCAFCENAPNTAVTTFCRAVAAAAGSASAPLSWDDSATARAAANSSCAVSRVTPFAAASV